MYKKAARILRQDGLGSLIKKGMVHGLTHIPRQGTPYYFRVKSWYNWKLSGEYDWRPNPFKIVRIDPNEINCVSKNRFQYRKAIFSNGGQVYAGNWDRNCSEFSKKPEFRSFRSHFCNGVPWRKTEHFNSIIDRIAAGSTSVRFSSVAEVKKRFKSYDTIYNNIKNHGYKSKKELIKSDLEDPLSKRPSTNPERFKYIHDEVVVNVGRNGELLFCGGHHRLSIAKILDIREIPVRIFVRHEKWQEDLDDFYNKPRYNRTKSVEKLHPDKREIAHELEV